MGSLFISKLLYLQELLGWLGEEERRSRRSEVAVEGGYAYPLVVESFGFWTPSSLAVLKIIISKTTARIMFGPARIT